MTNEQPREKPPNFLEIHAANHPDKTAVIGLDQSLTYAELRERVRALAGSLYDLGVRPGDQGALMTYNHPVHAEVTIRNGKTWSHARHVNRPTIGSQCRCRRSRLPHHRERVAPSHVRRDYQSCWCCLAERPRDAQE